jgi:phosphate/sulfate permease
MEFIYIGIIVFLFILAVSDLIVGVSNDAVNFLNSAVGAKTAKFKTIMIIAAVGVFAGAIMSNGMMDIARHGIYQPQYFTFAELMCIMLAVMVTDVLLLDAFNTMGMPTSTTVSLVFELLGGTVALAIIKNVTSDGALTFAQMINTDKALSVVLGIFLSIAIAFFFGMLVQWITRMIFTFNYKRKNSTSLFIYFYIYFRYTFKYF